MQLRLWHRTKLLSKWVSDFKLVKRNADIREGLMGEVRSAMMAAGETVSEHSIKRELTAPKMRLRGTPSDRARRARAKGFTEAQIAERMHEKLLSPPIELPIEAPRHSDTAQTLLMVHQSVRLSGEPVIQIKPGVPTQEELVDSAFLHRFGEHEGGSGEDVSDEVSSGISDSDSDSDSGSTSARGIESRKRSRCGRGTQ